MKKKYIIWGIVIAIAASGIALSVSKKDKEKYVEVKTSRVTQGNIKAYLSTTAVVKSKTSKDYFPLQGKVKKVNIKVGDTVTKGQTLVEYEITDPNAAVKQAQIQYDNAVLSKQMLINNNNDINNKIAEIDKQIEEVDNQIAELQKNPNIAKGSAANQSTPAELQNLKSQLSKSKESLKPVSSEQFKQADNSIALAKITLDNAKLNLSKSQDKIIADFDGVVTAVNAVEGATSMAGAQAVVTVQDVSDLKAVLSVGKYDAAKIKAGQAAEIKGFDKIYNGKVSVVEPAARKSITAAGSDTTLGVEIDILEKTEDLKIDFDVDVDVLLGEVKDVLKVPAESIRTNKEGKSFIYIVEAGRAVEKEVKLGMQSDMEAQVIEGITASNTVILNPSENIKNGTVVKEAGNE